MRKRRREKRQGRFRRINPALDQQFRESISKDDVRGEKRRRRNSIRQRLHFFRVSWFEVPAHG